MKIIMNFRKYSTHRKQFYISTPIYYVNASPHIGHLYSSVIADAIQKFQKLKQDNDVFFATGTDEHGTKIQQAALKNQKPLEEYCSLISSNYKTMFDSFNIDYNSFIRTTDQKHRKAVHHFWETLDKNGHIYSANYSGWYCISDETFLTDLELTEQTLPNGIKIRVSAASGHPVEWTEERNYMFKLANFQDNLKIWLMRNENVIQPKKFYKILLDWVTKDEFRDVSISRPTSRVHWGIPVPSDSTQTVYVWMDALINYLSIIGYPNKSYKNNWPPDVHVIGKDILKFHGIYWPAFLMAADMEPPKMILCHSHWTVDGEKMSKSKNNVISPMELSKAYTTDGIRYFLLREGVAHSDGNYSETKLLRILNSELADTFGNLLSRCSGTALNPNLIKPKINKNVFNSMLEIEETKKLIDSLEGLENVCYKHYSEYNFYKVADCVMATLHVANLFVETMKPWKLKKMEQSLPQLNVTLHLALETLRICGIILQPIIPNVTSQLLDKLNIPSNQRYWQNIKKFSYMDESFGGTNLSEEKITLFKRMLTEDKKQKIKVGKS